MGIIWERVFSRKYGNSIAFWIYEAHYNIWYKIWKPHHASYKNLTNFHTLPWKLQNPHLLPGCSTFFNGQKRLFFSVPAPLCASAGGHTLVDLWEEELHLSFWLEFGWVEGAELDNGDKVFSKVVFQTNVSLIPFFVFGFCSLWEMKLRKYENIM